VHHLLFEFDSYWSDLNSDDYSTDICTGFYTKTCINPTLAA